MLTSIGSKAISSLLSFCPLEVETETDPASPDIDSVAVEDTDAVDHTLILRVTAAAAEEVDVGAVGDRNAVDDAGCGATRRRVGRARATAAFENVKFGTVTNGDAVDEAFDGPVRVGLSENVDVGTVEDADAVDDAVGVAAAAASFEEDWVIEEVDTGAVEDGDPFDDAACATGRIGRRLIATAGSRRSADCEEGPEESKSG